VGKAVPDFVKHWFGLERMLDETMQVYGAMLKQHAPQENRF